GELAEDSGGLGQRADVFDWQTGATAQTRQQSSANIMSDVASTGQFVSAVEGGSTTGFSNLFQAGGLPSMSGGLGTGTAPTAAGGKDPEVARTPDTTSPPPPKGHTQRATAVERVRAKRPQRQGKGSDTHGGQAPTLKADFTKNTRVEGGTGAQATAHSQELDTTTVGSEVSEYTPKTKTTSVAADGNNPAEAQIRHLEQQRDAAREMQRHGHQRITESNALEANATNTASAMAQTHQLNTLQRSNAEADLTAQTEGIAFMQQQQTMGSDLQGQLTTQATASLGIDADTQEHGQQTHLNATSAHGQSAQGDSAAQGAVGPVGQVSTSAVTGSLGDLGGGMGQIMQFASMINDPMSMVGMLMSEFSGTAQDTGAQAGVKNAEAADASKTLSQAAELNTAAIAQTDATTTQAARIEANAQASTATAQTGRVEASQQIAEAERLEQQIDHAIQTRLDAIPDALQPGSGNTNADAALPHPSPAPQQDGESEPSEPQKGAKDTATDVEGKAQQAKAGGDDQADGTTQRPKPQQEDQPGLDGPHAPAEDVDQDLLKLETSESDATENIAEHVGELSRIRGADETSKLSKGPRQPSKPTREKPKTLDEAHALGEEIKAQHTSSTSRRQGKKTHTSPTQAEVQSLQPQPELGVVPSVPKATVRGDMEVPIPKPVVQPDSGTQPRTQGSEPKRKQGREAIEEAMGNVSKALEDHAGMLDAVGATKATQDAMVAASMGTDALVSEPIAEAQDLTQEALALARQGQRRPLPFKEPLENYYGVDLSRVECYFGPSAAEACAKVGAKAFSAGNIIAFASDNVTYDEVAHEVAHVIQQGGHGQDGGMAAGGELAMSMPNDAVEQEADAMTAEGIRGIAARQGRQPTQLARLVDVNGTQPDVLHDIVAGAEPVNAAQQSRQFVHTTRDIGQALAEANQGINSATAFPIGASGGGLSSCMGGMAQVQGSLDFEQSLQPAEGNFVAQAVGMVESICNMVLSIVGVFTQTIGVIVDMVSMLVSLLDMIAMILRIVAIALQAIGAALIAMVLTAGVGASLQSAAMSLHSAATSISNVSQTVSRALEPLERAMDMLSQVEQAVQVIAALCSVIRMASDVFDYATGDTAAQRDGESMAITEGIGQLGSALGQLASSGYTGFGQAFEAGNLPTLPEHAAQQPSALPQDGAKPNPGGTAQSSGSANAGNPSRHESLPALQGAAGGMDDSMGSGMMGSLGNTAGEESSGSFMSIFMSALSGAGGGGMGGGMMGGGMMGGGGMGGGMGGSMMGGGMGGDPIMGLLGSVLPMPDVMGGQVRDDVTSGASSLTSRPHQAQNAQEAPSSRQGTPDSTHSGGSTKRGAGGPGESGKREEADLAAPGRAGGAPSGTKGADAARHMPREQYPLGIAPVLDYLNQLDERQHESLVLQQDAQRRLHQANALDDNATQTAESVAKGRDASRRQQQNASQSLQGQRKGRSFMAGLRAKGAGLGQQITQRMGMAQSVLGGASEASNLTEMGVGIAAGGAQGGMGASTMAGPGSMLQGSVMEGFTGQLGGSADAMGGAQGASGGPMAMIGGMMSQFMGMASGIQEQNQVKNREATGAQQRLAGAQVRDEGALRGSAANTQTATQIGARARHTQTRARQASATANQQLQRAQKLEQDTEHAHETTSPSLAQLRCHAGKLAQDRASSSHAS
ncbi:MAG: DUF4157 domain-containing protein, partial [Myxococcota bacterium]